MSPIGDFVKEKRKLAKLTQEEFALKAGVALTVVRKIEHGKGQPKPHQSKPGVNDVWPCTGADK